MTIRAVAAITWREPDSVVLVSREEVAARQRVARSDYVAVFRVVFDLTPPQEWLDRWWPEARQLAPRVVAAIPPPWPPPLLDDAGP